MVSATPAKLPDASDRRMWRRVLARLHPDRGGDGEAFAWAQAVRERVEVASLDGRCESCPAAPLSRRRESYQASAGQDHDEPARVLYDVHPGEFDAVTTRALRIAHEVEEPFAGLLRLLTGLVGED
jgi:hypothetical protein